MNCSVTDGEKKYNRTEDSMDLESMDLESMDLICKVEKQVLRNYKEY